MVNNDIVHPKIQATSIGPSMGYLATAMLRQLIKISTSPQHNLRPRRRHRHRRNPPVLRLLSFAPVFPTPGNPQVKLPHQPRQHQLHLQRSKEPSRAACASMSKRQASPRRLHHLLLLQESPWLKVQRISVIGGIHLDGGDRHSECYSSRDSGGCTTRNECVGF